MNWWAVQWCERVWDGPYQRMEPRGLPMVIWAADAESAIQRSVRPLPTPGWSSLMFVYAFQVKAEEVR